MLAISDPHSRSETGPGRDGKGRFLPGTSGNPAGRPRTDECRRLLEEASPAATRRLIELSAQTADLAVSLRATDSILDRHLGKAATVLTGPDGGPVRHEHGLDPETWATLAAVLAEVLGEPDGL